ncbi:ATP synthase F1 subunit epsilon [Clostridium thermobutyricum]
MDSYELEIITPYKKAFCENIKMITLKNGSGEFTILKEFKNFICSLLPGVIKIEKENGEILELFLSEGILAVKNDKVIICTSSVELKEEINLEKAKKAKERAEKRLKEKEVNDIRAILSLKRAIERIDFINSKR